MKKNRSVFTALFVLVLSLVLLTGCVPPARTTFVEIPEAPAAVLAGEPEGITGGVLCLKINPEIALHYDETGKVTKLEGRNADGENILEGITGYAGKDTSQVLTELVELIGKAGYFVEEADGSARKIVLELDPGSQVPHEQFLEDMAAHVKSCVENKSWVGQKEYEYLDTVPATEPTIPTTGSTASSSVPAGLCPVCADDDCDEGIYCDDAHEKAENLREYERLMSGKVCSVCGDYDCDDGKYCDDADEKAENLREAELKKEKLSGSGGTTSSTQTGSSTKNSTSTKTTTSTVPAGLCPVCADDDCNDGKYCDDADDKAENLREYENRKNGTPCAICGDYDCDDGKYCDDADEKAENERENAQKSSSSTQKTTTKKTTTEKTTKTKCSVCGDYDCDDGKYCDDWDDRYDDDDVDHHDDDHHDDD